MCAMMAVFLLAVPATADEFLFETNMGDFTVVTGHARYAGLRCSLPGRHQHDNARVAIVALEAAREALAAYVEDVREGRFPSADESYGDPTAQAEGLEILLGTVMPCKGFPLPGYCTPDVEVERLDFFVDGQFQGRVEEPPFKLLVDIGDNVPNHKLVVLSTGSQGEPRSALVRIANDSHRDLLRQEGRDYYKTGTLYGINTRAGYIENGNGGYYRYVVMINTPGKSTRPVMRKLLQALE